MNPGTLDRKIQLQRATETAGRFGETEFTWTVLHIRWAKRIEKSGRETEANARERTEGAVTFRTRFTAPLATSDRLVDVTDGQAYDIADFSGDRRQGWMEIYCTRHRTPQNANRVISLALLEPAGPDNDIRLDGDADTAGIVIDDTTDRTLITATKNAGAITLTSGDKRVMEVTGDFGAGPETFVLPREAPSDWRLTDTESFFTVLNIDGANWQLTKTNLSDFSESAFTLPKNNTFPDQEDWSNATTSGGAIGTPAVTAHPATAAQAVAQLDALEGITAQNAPGNDGTGFVDNVGPVNFTP